MKFAIPVILASVLAMPAAATTLRITVTNDTGALDSGGFALTPVYAAFHDGAFDAFDVGSAASGGVERLAEVGQFAPGLDGNGDPLPSLVDERNAATSSSQAQVFSSFTPTGRRPLFAGESDTVEVTIDDPTDRRFFTFLSMVIPTNDLFIGTDDALELFDTGGNFIGPNSISITGAGIYDAGTEVNDPTTGVAFAAGQNGGAGTDEGGVITAGFDQLAQFIGLGTAAGFTIADTQGLLGGTSASAFSVATISFEVVQPAPIPLPAGGLLMLSALGLGGVAARRRKQRS